MTRAWAMGKKNDQAKCHQQSGQQGDQGATGKCRTNHLKTKTGLWWAGAAEVCGQGVGLVWSAGVLLLASVPRVFPAGCMKTVRFNFSNRIGIDVLLVLWF
jgi:hypothetical protein